jgi:hypothetical protein
VLQLALQLVLQWNCNWCYWQEENGTATATGTATAIGTTTATGTANLGFYEETLIFF